jgi:hypothetical protein
MIDVGGPTAEIPSYCAKLGICKEINTAIIAYTAADALLEQLNNACHTILFVTIRKRANIGEDDRCCLTVEVLSGAPPDKEAKDKSNNEKVCRPERREANRC